MDHNGKIGKMDHARPVMPGTFPLCEEGVVDVWEFFSHLNVICCVFEILF